MAATTFDKPVGTEIKTLSDQIATINNKIANLSTTSIETYTAIEAGQTATNVAISVNVAKTGYIPISVGYRCNQLTMNVWRCEFTGVNTVTVGVNGLTSTSTVSINVVYIKSP